MYSKVLPTLSPVLRYLPSRRTLFNLHDLSKLSPWESEIQTYHEQKLFPYNQNQLYNIVADVHSYPRFVPFCTASRILNSTQQPTEDLPDLSLLMEAELTVRFLTFKESYVSKVRCTPFESVEAAATSSTPLFKTLSTLWRFQPASAPSTHSTAGGLQHSIQRRPTLGNDHAKGSTLVTLDLAFAFANPVYATVSAGFFGQASKLMVKAFEERCREVYGPGRE